MARLSGERDIAFVDIFDLSERAASDRTLVADDGLHPSGVQYATWVDTDRPGRALRDGLTADTTADLGVRAHRYPSLTIAPR